MKEYIRNTLMVILAILAIAAIFAYIYINNFQPVYLDQPFEDGGTKFIALTAIQST